MSMSGLYGNPTSAQSMSATGNATYWDIPKLTRVTNGSAKIANTDDAAISSSISNTTISNTGKSSSGINSTVISSGAVSGTNHSGHDINQDMMHMNLNSIMGTTNSR